MRLFLKNMVPTACVVMAGLMALYDKSGWGWFLLIALLTA